MKHDLKQEVAEFVPEIVHVVTIDRVCHLIGLFDRIRRNTCERLLNVPGAATLGLPEPTHDFE